MRRNLVVVLFALVCASSASAQGQSRFAGWTTAVIAGDWRAGDQPIQAFDNALRDLSAGFVAAGLPAETLVSRSLRPDVPNPVSVKSAVNDIAAAMERGQAGCLLYFTSHGSPEGIVLGPDTTLTPAMAAVLVRRWCGARPTVVVLSACFSGVFTNALQAPNRMVLTAARRDRTSFGCGANETYPWFDGCVIETLPQASDFLNLASLTKACVARREAEAGVERPSEPQVFVGSEMQLRLPLLRFRRAAS